MQKIVAKVGLTRHVVKEFEDEINSLCEAGWTVKYFCVEKKFLRLVCQAMLCTGTCCCKCCGCCCNDRCCNDKGDSCKDDHKKHDKKDHCKRDSCRVVKAEHE